MDRPTKPKRSTPAQSGVDEESACPSIDEQYWALTRECAENGDFEASLDLLDAALWSLQSDQPMNVDVRDFLIRSLSEIVEKGIPAHEALMLTKPKHRVKGETSDRDSALAAAMVLVRREHPTENKAASALRVIEWIGARWGLQSPHDVDEKDTGKLVVRAHDAHAGTYERFEDDLLRQLALQLPNIKTRR
jgi:hypothetical protein